MLRTVYMNLSIYIYPTQVAHSRAGPPACIRIRALASKGVVGIGHASAGDRGTRPPAPARAHTHTAATCLRACRQVDRAVVRWRCLFAAAGQYACMAPDDGYDHIGRARGPRRSGPIPYTRAAVAFVFLAGHMQCTGDPWTRWMMIVGAVPSHGRN